MATPAMSQPDATSQPNQAGPSPSGAPQANQLQTALAQLAKVCEQMAQQNPVVQAELSQARQQFIQALQKTMMAARPQEPSTPAPQNQ